MAPFKIALAAATFVSFDGIYYTLRLHIIKCYVKEQRKGLLPKFLSCFSNANAMRCQAYGSCSNDLVGQKCVVLKLVILGPSEHARRLTALQVIMTALHT
jgi:hypothetical protein